MLQWNEESLEASQSVRPNPFKTNKPLAQGAKFVVKCERLSLARAPRARKDMVKTYGTHTKTIKHTHAQLLYRYIYIFIHIRKYQKYIYIYQIWSDCIFDVILEPSLSSDSSISGYFLLGYEGEICSSDSLVDRLEDVDVLQKLERVPWQKTPLYENLLWTYGANGCPSVVESICKIDLHRTAVC